jgi:cytochrome c biogenesis protein CcdA/thiol-disulfide isomerase/thioredoxin
MILLTLVALLAGAGTALSPCVLPVLPALLSAGAAGGRRRPLGIAIGLAATFTVTVVALAAVVNGVGLADGATRWVAVAGLGLAGLALLVPAVGDRFETWLAPLGRRGPTGKGDGFASGLAVGGALGFVYAPCAGPVLGAVVSVSASQGASARVITIALAYALGSALVLGVLALGGQRIAERIRAAGRGPALQRGLGVVLAATAVAVALNLDVRFQTAIANHLPSALVNPTKGLEDTSAVKDQLKSLRGAPKFAATKPAAEADRASRAAAASLPVLGAAPDFTNNERWFNTPGGRPLTLAGLRGRVVLVDFWTYTCINCLRTLPFIRALDQRYRDAGLTIVGVHTPEFTFERDAGNVQRAISDNSLRYPVAQDNAYGTWNAWGNQYWPADYLVDARGRVRFVHFGEGEEAKTEAAIRGLLRERGDGNLGAAGVQPGIQPSAGEATPETYLGSARAERFLPAAPKPGFHDYPAYRGDIPLSHFALSGRWRTDQESSTALGNSHIDVQFQAAKVYLVLSSKGGSPRRVGVRVDGRPVGAGSAGADARNGAVTVRNQRLYELVALPRSGTHRLRLDLDPGVSGFAFTFG